MLSQSPVSTASRPATSRTNGRVAPRRRPRTKFRFLAAGLVIFAAIGYMMYTAIQSGSEYYVTVSELKAMGEPALGQPIKIGGEVVEGSIEWNRGANTVAFSITDGKATIPASYTGVVPDTFQPGAEAILEGKLGADGRFQATSIMAKCASKYVAAQ